LSDAVAIEVPRQVEVESHTLTSLFNRGVIVDLLGREISRSRREHDPVTILMSDVDHFKIINDTHGHLIGDEVLKEAARRMLLSVRSYDYVGRYGGEQFLIILYNCDPASTPRRAEEIRKALSDHPVETSTGTLLVTMSMGVHQTENWGEHTVEALLHQVDSAMYAAKAAGRNRIRFTEPDGPKLARWHRRKQYNRRHEVNSRGRRFLAV
jgi:two-component system, cell cycle response regulator